MADKYAHMPKSTSLSNMQVRYGKRRRPPARLRQCITAAGIPKAGFFTFEEAMKSNGVKKGGLRPYECEVCGRWHLTKRKEEKFAPARSLSAPDRQLWYTA